MCFWSYTRLFEHKNIKGIEQRDWYLFKSSAEIGCTSELLATVEWWKIILFSQVIPGHLFFCWHVITGRLSTQDSMLNWSYTGDLKCVLHRKSLECRVHLYFECFFTRGIWKELMKGFLISSLKFVWVRKKISRRENL